MEYFKPALNIFEAEAYITLIQLVKISLCDSPSIVVQADKELVAACILGEMDKACIAMLQDIVDQFLDNAEDDKLVLGLESFPVVVEAGAGVHTAGAADLLEKVIHGGFKSKILECGGHQGVADIPDELDRIVDDLLGVIDALQLGSFIEIDEILIQVKPGSGKERAGIIMKVGGDPLAFFFLEPDAGIKQQFLLVLLHSLEP